MHLSGRRTFHLEGRASAKGPEVGAHLACSKNSKEASLGRAEKEGDTGG